MVQPKPVEDRIAAQEAKADALETDVLELRDLMAQVRAALTRLEGYERELQWLQAERRKAR